MDLSDYTIEELRMLRNEVKNDLEDLKKELQTVKAIQYPKIEDCLNKLKQQEKRSSCWADNKFSDDVLNFLKKITGIESVNMSNQIATVEGDSWFSYTFTVRFNRIVVQIEYQSNMPFSCKLQNDEIIKYTKYQILEPNIQSRLKDAITFLQTGPKYSHAAILFFQSLSDLYDCRANVLKRLTNEYDKNISVMNIRKTDNFGVAFFGTTEETVFVVIKWYLVWDKKTMMAKDLFKSELCAHEELNELVNVITNLSTDSNSTEESKYISIRNVIIAVKDIDTRSYLENNVN